LFADEVAPTALMAESQGKSLQKHPFLVNPVGSEVKALKNYCLRMNQSLVWAAGLVFAELV
jgi:hypothetical protein